MPDDSRSVLWTGKPWIFPGVLGRSVLVFAITVAVFWLELTFVSSVSVFNPLILGTALVFFLIWILSLIHLLLLKASNTYVLRNDSLEIRTGILTSRSYVVTPSGFSDLEVIRSIPARIINSGDIIIRSQSENDSDKIMVRIRNSTKVAAQIREVMARPIVRIEKPEPTEEKK